MRLAAIFFLKFLEILFTSCLPRWVLRNFTYSQLKQPTISKNFIFLFYEEHGSINVSHGSGRIQSD